MSKDNKQNVTAALNKPAVVPKTTRDVLPQSLFAAAAASKSLSSNIKDDYEVVVSPAAVPDQKSRLLPSSSSSPLPCGSQSAGSGKDDSNAKGSNSLAASLRDLILKNHSEYYDRLNRYKLSYIRAVITPGTAVQSVSLTDTNYGTAVYQRLQNLIYIKKLNVKWALNFTTNGHGGASYVVPVVGLCIVVDKINEQPGTSPTLFSVDTNPPAADAVYTQLGGVTNAARLVAPRAPGVVVKYDVLYHEFIYEPEPRDFNLNGNSPGNVTQMPFQKSGFIDLTRRVHNMQQIYQDASATSAIVNNIWLYIYTNTAPSGGGYSFEVSSEMAFEDAPSDG